MNYDEINMKGVHKIMKNHTSQKTNDPDTIPAYKNVHTKICSGQTRTYSYHKPYQVLRNNEEIHQEAHIAIVFGETNDT